MVNNLSVFKVGMGSDTALIEAPSAQSAAIYYALEVVYTNNPFMAVVYEQDGKPFEGEHSWLNLTPTEEFARAIGRAIKDEIPLCRVVED